MSTEEQLGALEERVAASEGTVQQLYHSLQQLLAGNETQMPVGDVPEQLVQLNADNAKLRYQLKIIKRAAEAEQMKSASAPSDEQTSTVECLYANLCGLLTIAIRAAYPDIVDAPTCLTSGTKFADYQCNAAMPIMKLLKTQAGVKSSPRDVAQRIVDHVPANDYVDKLEVAGAGFINVFVKRDYVSEQLQRMLVQNVPPPPVHRKRVVIDYSSPNVAKEMHVGHLRSTIIGDGISRLLEYLGHDLVRVNHLGDWGTQFGMLVAHLADKFPNYVQETPPIQDLQAFYRESKKRFDEDADFKKRAYSFVVRLQSHDEDVLRGWRQICDVSLREFDKVLRRLDIRPLIARGESFYQSRMVDAVALLDQRGLLQEDEGRKVMFVPGHALPLTIVKSDGGYTYDTSDVATVRQRIEEERGEWLIYVVDAGQATHLQTIYSTARLLGWADDSVRIDHVSFGVVLGEDRKKFKTRSGETVRLVELLDEGLRRAMDKLKEKGRDQELTPEELRAAQEAVAYGCIKYADLVHNRNHDYVFSFDKMLDDRGNTAAYLLYSLTRIRSIVRNAQMTSKQLLAAAESGTRIQLLHEREWKLGRLLVRFPEVVQRVTEDLLLHQLCEFLYELSCTFTEFYDCCYCVQRDRITGDIISVDTSRLLLCEVTALVMARCFDILGIKTVQKM